MTNAIGIDVGQKFALVVGRCGVLLTLPQVEHVFADLTEDVIQPGKPRKRTLAGLL
jgi:hypothetical protein